MIIELDRVEIDAAMRTICTKEYPGHKNGCPNYGKKDTCPPKHPLFSALFNSSKPVYAAINEFDLAAHIDRMANKLPNWTDRQLSCCLYWQPKARKQLREQVDIFLYENPGLIVDYCPEAGGVNITTTLKRVGVILEWPPRNIVRQVAFIGNKKL